MIPGRRGAFALVFVLFLISGATGLVYEVVWLRQLILIFGSTQFATSTILSTFMAGLALGAFLAGRSTALRAWSPLRAYGLLEIGIGLYALAVPSMFRGLVPIYRLLWEAGASESFLLFSIVKFVGIGAVLLAPTVLMGASLPLLARVVADDPARIGGKVGTLYSVNILGAVVGVFVAGFVAIPTIGVQGTIRAAALANFAVGVAALLTAGRLAPAARIEHVAVATRRAEGPLPRLATVALLAFGVSGFGALALEVAWTRVLSLVLGSSVYAFSLMLLAFLVGLAAGGAVFSGLLRSRPGMDPAGLLTGLLAGSGVAAYLSGHFLQYLPPLVGQWLLAWRPGAHGWFAAQFAAGVLVMFPATFLLGGIFPAVLQLHARRLEDVALSVGTVYTANTTGTILGAAAAGFVLIPGFGVNLTVVGVAAVQVLLALSIVWVAAPRPRSRTAATLVALGLVAGMVALRPTWNGQLMNVGVFGLLGETRQRTWDDFADRDDTVVMYEAEGLTAHVFVADEPRYHNRYLSVNGKVEASSRSDLETQLLVAHLPLLLHESPKDVLIIGLASGITAGAAATHPVESIRIAEIEEKIIPAARLFDAYNGAVLDDPRVKLSINDARNELEFSPATYDVIISAPSNPWMTIAANLFTEEFFRTARGRMRPGGIYSQWVQNYYLSRDDLCSVVAAFRSAFPNVMVFEANDGVDLVLLGSERTLRFSPAQIGERMAELNVRLDLARADVNDPIDLLGTFRLGEREVARLTLGAAPNTDDNARVEFNAPKTLGQDTIEHNLRMLRQYAASVLDYVDPPIEVALERDRLRLSLVAALLDRDEPELARRTAMDLSEPALRAQADGLLGERHRP